MPETDRHALRMMTTALAERAGDQTITVINPDQSVAQRLQAHLDASVFWHKDHLEFLSARPRTGAAPGKGGTHG